MAHRLTEYISVTILDSNHFLQFVYLPLNLDVFKYLKSFIIVKNILLIRACQDVEKAINLHNLNQGNNMGGNGFDNAHRSAFSGGRNPSLSGCSGYSAGGNEARHGGNNSSSGIMVCRWVIDNDKIQSNDFGTDSRGNPRITIRKGPIKECVNIPLNVDIAENSRHGHRLIAVRGQPITLASKAGTHNNSLNALFSYRTGAREGDKVAAVLSEAGAIALTEGIASESSDTFLVQIACTDIFRISVNTDGTIKNVAKPFETEGGSSRNPNIPGKIKETRKNEAVQKLATYLDGLKNAAREEAARKAEEQQRHSAELQRQEDEHHRLLNDIAAKHPLSAAEKRVEFCQRHIEQKEREKNQVEQQLRENEHNLHILNGQYTTIKEAVQKRRVSRRMQLEGKRIPPLSINGMGVRSIAEWHHQATNLHRQIDHLQNEIHRLRSRLDNCHHQLHEAHHNKSLADSHLNSVREDIRREREAVIIHQAEETATLKAWQDAQKEAAEAERRREREEAEKAAQAAIKATEEAKRISEALIAVHIVEQGDSLFDRPGFQSITQQSLQARKATVSDSSINQPPAQLGASQSGAVPTMAVVATGMSGSAALTGNFAMQAKNAIAALSRMATVTPAGAIITALLAGFRSTEAGAGSDNVPGGKLIVKTLPASVLSMPIPEQLHQAAEGRHPIEAPFRGRLILANGEIHTELVRTVKPTLVQVVAGVHDGKGHYQCTLPATDDLPAKTILVNPANAPGIDGPGTLITPQSGPSPLPDTGGLALPPVPPTITTYPEMDEITFNDLIVVPPLESGDEPVYVMFSSPLNLTKPASKPVVGSQTDGGLPSGAENAAAYPKLKEDLLQQNLSNIARQDPRLAAVVQGGNGKLNYGVGSGTREEADRLGQIWVEEGAVPTSDGAGLVSVDGTRVYRFPKEKINAPVSFNPTGIQANFETYRINPATGQRERVGDAHLIIVSKEK